MEANECIMFFKKLMDKIQCLKIRGCGKTDEVTAELKLQQQYKALGDLEEWTSSRTLIQAFQPKRSCSPDLIQF